MAKNLQRKYFVGRDRRLSWSLPAVRPGQFVTFLYKSNKKGARMKRRYVLVLSERFIPSAMHKSRNTDRTYMLSGVDLYYIRNKPQELIQLFRSNRLGMKVNITTVDRDGFRFFESNIEDEKKTYRRLEKYLNKTIGTEGGSLYKTFDYDKLRATSVDLFNPRFPPEVIKKMNILNAGEWEEYMYE